MLEVGAANRETSRMLSRLIGGQTITAIDPQPESDMDCENVRFLNTTLEEYSHSGRRYDVIFSNHVMEHFEDPIGFLSLHRDLAKSTSLLIICCPNSSVPSVELLFDDHQAHLTCSAMCSAANSAGLLLEECFTAPWDEETAVAILRLPDRIKADPIETRPRGIRSVREKYFADWKSCQSALLQQAEGHELVLFGAGEFAQLIACYMPDLYRRVSSIVVENPEGARSFDRTVEQFDYQLPHGHLLLMGVHRKSRASVMARLAHKGFPMERVLIPAGI